MTESNKFDFFMDEFSSLEKQIYLYAQKCSDLFESNKVMLKKIEQLKKENELLRLKLDESGDSVNASGGETLINISSFNSEEKELIKKKIGELISRIDYHLRS